MYASFRSVTAKNGKILTPTPTGNFLLTSNVLGIGHFTVIDGSEAEGDLVLIQTFFALLWKLFLKNNS